MGKLFLWNVPYLNGNQTLMWTQRTDTWNLVYLIPYFQAIFPDALGSHRICCFCQHQITKYQFVVVCWMPNHILFVNIKDKHSATIILYKVWMQKKNNQKYLLVVIDEWHLKIQPSTHKACLNVFMNKNIYYVFKRKIVSNYNSASCKIDSYYNSASCRTINKDKKLITYQVWWHAV